jgi:oxygen-independent coproporphyrinogen III oxidase
VKATEADFLLIEKHNVPGPRYTSYPPATQFKNGLSVQQLLDKIRENNLTAGDLSLYFHLPFCRSLCWYCGCTTVITTNQSESAKYLDYLDRELELIAPVLNPERKVVQLHLGGGTPNFLTPEEIVQLGRMIRSRFNIAPDVEASVEIDPRRFTRSHLSALHETGFNRASIGVQDHNPLVQKAVHRIQPFALTKTVVEWMREAGFLSLNIDLIYGLPYQTPDSFAKTLDDVLELQPDRFAVFNYAHVPWLKPAQKILIEAALPSPRTKLQLLKVTVEKLISAGYVYIGMDHFSRANDELAIAQRQKTLQRNFQGYSTRGGADIYAFGMSAISKVDDFYWQNFKDLNAYYAALDRGQLPLAKGYILTADDRIRRQTIMRLMCDLELDYAEMSRLLDVDFVEYFGRELESLDDLEADGLVLKSPSGLVVTNLGRLLIRNIAMRFDAYIPTRTQHKFSQAI